MKFSKRNNIVSNTVSNFFIFLTSVRNEIGNQCQGSLDNCFIHIRDQSTYKMAVFLSLTKEEIQPL